MMHDITTDKWFLCYDLADGTFHYGLAKSPAILTTGQPNCEMFDTEETLASRIDGLKGVSGWYEANKPTAAEPTIPSNVT